MPTHKQRAIDQYIKTVEDRYKIERTTLKMGTTDRLADTPAAGVLIYDDDLNTMYLGDGSTAGGVQMADAESTGLLSFDTNSTRAISIGTKATAASSITISAAAFEAEPGYNYQFGLFTAVAASAATSADELRSAWIRTRVNDGCHIGSNAGWGFGVCGAEIQLKVYASAAATNIYGWQNSAVWAQLETAGTSTITIKNGSYAQAVLANVGLTNTTVIESGAVVAGVTVNSNTSATGGHVTATGGFYGIYITDKTTTNLDFQSGIFIVDDVATTGITLGNATTGILLDGNFTDGIKLAESNTITTGITIGACTTGIAIGACTDGITFTGAYADSCIDFSAVTLNHSGSSGPVMIRAGSYGSPVTSSDPHQSGMIRLYSRNSALTDDGTGFYDRGVFVCMKTTGAKSIYPVSGLAEVEATVSGNGPTSVHACEFISHLLETGSKIASTATMHAGWFKVAAIAGATIPVGAIVAPLWVDNQLSGSNIGASGHLATEYGIYATTGGSKPRAFVGFSTLSSGFDNFISFDSTIASETMIGSADIDGGTADKYLKIDLNGTAYGIQLYAI